MVKLFLVSLTIILLFSCKQNNEPIYGETILSDTMVEYGEFKYFIGKEYHPNGLLKIESCVTSVNGVLEEQMNGYLKRYDSSGRIVGYSNYENGKIKGNAFLYDSLGVIKLSKFYNLKHEMVFATKNEGDKRFKTDSSLYLFLDTLDNKEIVGYENMRKFYSPYYGEEIKCISVYDNDTNVFIQEFKS